MGMSRTPQEIYKDDLLDAEYREKHKVINICEKCAIAESCKYHNKPENKEKVVRDCRKFQISDEVLKEIDNMHGNSKYEKVREYIAKEGINLSTRGFISK